MSNLDILLMGVRNLWRRKVRSLLTVLGVIIGTAAIVVMISLSVGIDKAMEQQFANMGDLSIIQVYPMWSENGQTVIDEELFEKLASIEGVEVATPIVDSYGKIIAGRYEANVSIVGVKTEALPYLGLKLAEGRLLEGTDDMHLLFGGQVPQMFQKSGRQFSVYKERGMSVRIGGYYGDPSGSSEELDVNVMEDTLKLTFDMSYGSGSNSDNRPPKVYRVETVGVMDKETYNNYSYQVIMPLETLMELQAENNDGQRPNQRAEVQYYQVILKARDLDDIEYITEQVEALDVRCHSLSQILEEAKKSTRMISLILGGIGAISMLVAALGITNTMVMSIYERTREIGVMKVLGAALGDIGRLFVVESAMIGLFGGLLGLGISYGISYFLNNVVMNMTGGMGMGAQMSIIPIWLALAALAFTSAVGLVAGLYPAMRAMRLSALEAIRTE